MITALLLAGCAADPGPVEETCTVVPVPAGEVRATRIVCEEQLVAGGEGRVGDWLIENAVARFVVRDTYASLTQLGEAGGGLVDASLLGGPDLLMELLPVGERGSASATVTGDEGVVEIGAFAWRLAADESTLHLEGESPTATWVPRPGPIDVELLDPIEPPADQEEWQAAVTMRDATRAAILARTGEPDLVHERVLDRMADEARGKEVG